MCIASIFAKLMLHRSSIIIKIVIDMMVIEAMYKAKSPHSFVDSRPRDVIARIRSLACYTESVKHGDELEGLRGNNRRRGCLSSPISSRNHSCYNGQSIVAAQLDVIGQMPAATRR